MDPANSYENILQRLDARRIPDIWMCGLLFAPPNTPIGKSLMDRLDDWHHRSGDNIDFFCVGYLDWKVFNDDKPVGCLRDRDGSEARQFYYSAQAFDDIRRNVETLSTWQYSGEADLLLDNVVQDEKHEYAYGHRSNVLDFSNQEFRQTLFKQSLDTVLKKLDLDGLLKSRHFIVGDHLLKSGG